MEAVLAVLVGVFFTVAIYLLLSRHVIRILLGVVVLGNAVNMLFFTAGRLTRSVPPAIDLDQWVPQFATANPLPQALVLTAIVISFSLFAFLLVLGYRSYEDLETDDTDEMRLAEPLDETGPPHGY
ncbi:MAG: Na+/H+ antiporter subunit C [Pseudomonadota bacterium]